jgi:hypothetical protein
VYPDSDVAVTATRVDEAADSPAQALRTEVPIVTYAAMPAANLTLSVGRIWAGDGWMSS